MAFLKNKIKNSGFLNLPCLQFHEAAAIHKRIAAVKHLVGIVSFIIAVGFSSAISVGAYADTDLYNKIHRINVPAMNAAEALNQLAYQTGTVLLFPYKDAKTQQSNTVVGEYTVMQAITVMLKNSGLVSSLTKDGAIRISVTGDRRQQKSGEMSDMNLTSKKKMYAALVGLLVGGGGTQVSLAEEVGGQGSLAMDEIIVTAGKRETSLQEAAMSISALDSDNIEKRGLVGMDDYLRSLPSVSMQDRGPGQNTITIRGLALSPQITSRPLTSIYFGEIPTTGLNHFRSSYTGGGSADIKMIDIERAEVLRGPQGTLYGSGSLGGTVRVIPVSPNLEKMEGKLGARYSNTSELGGDNTMVQAVLNVPLIEDTLAVRAVVYRFDNSGFYENVVASQPFDLNDDIVGMGSGQSGGVVQDQGDRGGDESTGFRLSALWQLTESIDATLTYLEEDVEQDGTPQANTSLEGKFQQRRVKTGVLGSNDDFFDTELSAANLVINVDLGWGTVTSATSLMDWATDLETDFTHRSFPWPAIGRDNILARYVASDSDTEAVIQEIRLVSELEGPLQYIAGLYYEDYQTEGLSTIQSSGNPTLPPTILLPRSNDLEQKAVFAEVSYDITEQLTATIGARHFDYSREQTDKRFLGQAKAHALIDEDGQTYKANISYNLNDDIMLYGQWAEGFRLGEGTAPSVDCGLFPAVDSDTVENYEVGFKSSLADNRVTLNGSLYHIKWEGIPVFFRTTVTPSCGVTENIGSAKSEGVELELQVRVTESVKLDVSTSYGEAEIKEDIEGTFFQASSGDALPGASDFSFSLGAEYQFTLGGYDSFVRYDYAYGSEYYNSTDEEGLTSGGFGLSNVKVGIAFNQVAVDVFVNNLTNDDGITWADTANNLGVLSDGSTGTLEDSRINRVRPRTIGLNVNYHF